MHHHLQVRNADVERFVHVSIPHESDVGDVKRPEITLKNRD